MQGEGQAHAQSLNSTHPERLALEVRFGKLAASCRSCKFFQVH